MKTQINLTLPEDFSTLCSIYQVNPETLLQSFVDKVSLSRFYNHHNGNDRWATFFFLNHLDTQQHEVDEELKNLYLDAFSQTLLETHQQHPKDQLKSEQAGRKVTEQWLKAVLNKRAAHLTQNL